MSLEGLTEVFQHPQAMPKSDRLRVRGDVIASALQNLAAIGNDRVAGNPTCHG